MSDPNSAGRLISVLVADDHELFRVGIQAVIDSEPDLEIVATADDGPSAVEAARQHAPDLAVVGRELRGFDGIEATAAILEASPATRVLVLTNADDPAGLFAAVRAGARAYLLKELAVRELAGALRLVARGDALVSPSLTSALFDEFRRAAAQGEAQPVDRLTPREREVLGVMSSGLTNKQIAAQLGMAENTVKNHVGNILEKLGLSTRAEASAFAARHGVAPGGLPPR